MGFGSLMLGPNTGLLYNDEMDDFSSPGAPNGFGLAPSASNFIGSPPFKIPFLPRADLPSVPRKRPLSSMSPTIVLKDGKPVAALGGSGGSRIITSTLQVLLPILLLGQDPQTAVAQPRLHHQWLPNQVEIEPEYDTGIVADLRARGHTVRIAIPSLPIAHTCRSKLASSAASTP